MTDVPRMFGRLAAGLVASALLLCSGVAGAEIVDRIVAKVGDDIITEHQLSEAIEPYLLQQGTPPSEIEGRKDDPELRRTVLDKMIERQLIESEAEEMGLSIDESRVDRLVAMTRKKRGLSEERFRMMIERYGISFSEYRGILRHNLLKRKLLQAKLGSRVSVSSSEVDEVYRRRFGDPGAAAKQVKVRHILVQPDGNGKKAKKRAERRARKIVKKLEKGAEFATLAEKYSDDPSASKGGLLGTFRRGELQPAIENVAFSLKEGAHSGVIRTDYGYHIVEVVDVSRAPSGKVGERRKAIRRELKQKKLTEKLDSLLEDLRSETLVEISL
ncbi:MAG: peptidylprolyl isomerase [Bradymonadaceae bacterium]